MGFVIRASDKLGTVGWVHPKDERGIRTFGKRDTAEVFPDSVSASATANQMPAIFGGMVLEYLVESLGATSELDVGRNDDFAEGENPR